MTEKEAKSDDFLIQRHESNANTKKYLKQRKSRVRQRSQSWDPIKHKAISEQTEIFVPQSTNSSSVLRTMSLKSIKRAIKKIKLTPEFDLENDESMHPVLLKKSGIYFPSLTIKFQEKSDAYEKSKRKEKLLKTLAKNEKRRAEIDEILKHTHESKNKAHRTLQFFKESHVFGNKCSISQVMFEDPNQNNTTQTEN